MEEGDQANPPVGRDGTIYRSYLLRLWRTEADAPWRAMLESVTEPGERHHFPDLERMLAFLLGGIQSCERHF